MMRFNGCGAMPHEAIVDAVVRIGEQAHGRLALRLHYIDWVRIACFSPRWVQPTEQARETPEGKRRRMLDLTTLLPREEQSIVAFIDEDVPQGQAFIDTWSGTRLAEISF